MLFGKKVPIGQKNMLGILRDEDIHLCCAAFAFESVLLVMIIVSTAAELPRDGPAPYPSSFWDPVRESQMWVQPSNGCSVLSQLTLVASSKATKMCTTRGSKIRAARNGWLKFCTRCPGRFRTRIATRSLCHTHLGICIQMHISL